MKTYLKHKIHNVVEIKGLTALEYLDFEGKYKNYEEKHNFWELCYIESGYVMLNLEGKHIALKSGDLFFVPPEKTHSYASRFSHKSKAFVVCFETFSYAVKPLGNIIFPLDDALKECVNKIIVEYRFTFFMNDKDHLEVLDNPNIGGQQAIILQLEYLIICLLRRLSAKKNPGVVFFDNDHFYSKLSGIIIEYLHENVNSKLSLSDICNKVNYSRSFLCKTFKEQTGETLFSYFNKIKINEAKKLLRETDLSITAISKELGFMDVKYFGSLFKKSEGQTPSEYKKVVSQNKENI